MRARNPQKERKSVRVERGTRPVAPQAGGTKEPLRGYNLGSPGVEPQSAQSLAHRAPIHWSCLNIASRATPASAVYVLNLHVQNADRSSLCLG